MIAKMFLGVPRFLLPSVILFILFITTCKVQAQLCNGSLGDPVVNITFGSGDGPGPALSAAATSYQYATNACPVNGYYSLLNRGVECNYGWHILKGDHTGNPNGYFMLIDASFEPGDFYLDTVKNLCPNTTYEFAAWMLNMKYVLQGTRPNITFKIETLTGLVLQTYNSGDIPVEQTINWKQYGFYFTTPLNVSGVVLRMTNNAPGGDGNDLALDDISFRPCGDLITAAVQANASDTIEVCEDNMNEYTFSATVSSGYISPVYQWQLSTDKGAHWNDIAGADGITYLRRAAAAGFYWYRFTIAENSLSGLAACRIASTPVKVNVYPVPLVNAGPDRYIVSGNTVSLAASATGEALQYLWAPDSYVDDRTKLTPAISPLQDIRYTLLVTSKYGCTATDDVSVKVVNDLYVPTAFTPNGDGKNDEWKIPFLDPAYEAEVFVYNRYGQMVYHVAGKIVSWDGRVNGMLQPPGAYVYLVRFKTGKEKIAGTLTLIR